MTRVFLFFSALVWLPYGLFLTVLPDKLAGIAGVVATSATGTVELRAMYGGLEVAIGALCLAAAVSPAWRTHGLAALAFLYTGLASTRLIATLGAGEFSFYLIAALAVELPSAIVAIWLLGRERQPLAARS